MSGGSIASQIENKSENARCSAAKMQENPSDLDDAALLASATPAMKQYLQIKTRHADCLLFYRMGDFYELFFDDAVDAAAILDIALTKRGKHGGEDIPMCGVPVHSHEVYLEKLIASGRKVAICEQLETPEQAKQRGGYKAVVSRDVVRIVTPGTITEESLLAPDRSHYLAALAQAKGAWALAWMELSTGHFRVMETAPERLSSDLARIDPRELLLSESLWQSDELAMRLAEWKGIISSQPNSQFDPKKTERVLLSHYSVATLEAFGELAAADIAACGALLEYIRLTQLEHLPRLDVPAKEQAQSAMVIDAATRRNLELASTLSGSRKGSLLSVIDCTRTASGGRLLAQWLMSPLTQPAAIGARQDAVAWCLEQREMYHFIRDALAAAPDMERSLSRLCLERGGPRDMLAIRSGLEVAQRIKQRIMLAQQNPSFAQGVPAMLRDMQNGMKDQTELVNMLAAALVESPPLMARDGNFIASGYRADLDEFRRLRDESKRVIAAMQQRYAEQSGIATLKIKFNGVLGYFIEITPSHESKVPEFFIHRQSLANALRYTTTELAETARAISEAGDKALHVEQECFAQLLASIRTESDAIVATARALAQWDVLSSLAELAESEGYVRPVIDDSLAFSVEGGRHPVVEQSLKKKAESFVGNDCDLGEVQRLWLLTGPNMAGKSTFLRQNALIVILAQMGSFVPARAAHIGVVDRLFSRVGAADDLARGQSTFMVEMVETAMILNQSTARSLVILDEIGRGTATYDGLSIAWAVVEHLHDAIACRGLFATHYHELTQLAQSLAALSCHSMQVKEWKGQVVFLHQVASGTADRSYGIHVAQLAGLPRDVTQRAKQILQQLQNGQGELTLVKPAAPLPLFDHVSSSPLQPDVLREAVDALDVDNMSPRAALDALYRLKQL